MRFFATAALVLYAGFATASGRCASSGEEMMRLFERIREEKLSDAVCWTNAGILAVNDGRAALARGCFMKALLLDPGLSEARWHLARIDNRMKSIVLNEHRGRIDWTLRHLPVALGTVCDFSLGLLAFSGALALFSFFAARGGRTARVVAAGFTIGLIGVAFVFWVRSEKVAVVVNPGTRLRLFASDDSAGVADVRPGQALRIEAESGPFVRTRLPDGATGWLRIDDLILLDER